LVHNGAMITKTYPPTPEVRLTIPVSAEVHAAFTRVAKAGNMPVGRAMGEWLGDTIDAVQFMAEKMEQARSAPALVARELHSYALGLTEETQGLMAHLRSKGRADRAQSQAQRPATGQPAAAKKATSPVSNTGGKVSGARSASSSKRGPK
jgi:hypothetical protein